MVCKNMIKLCKGYKAFQNVLNNNYVNCFNDSKIECSIKINTFVCVFNVIMKRTCAFTLNRIEK